MKNYIATTHSGGIDLNNIKPHHINIIDIAKSLGCTVRWRGYTVFPYTVSQHSVLLSQQVSPAAALWGLMHDAAEAYIGDIPTPIKCLSQKRRENRILDVIKNIWNIELTQDVIDEVHEADKRMGATEYRQLMKPNDILEKQFLGVESYHSMVFKYLDYETAQREFLNRHEELTKI